MKKLTVIISGLLLLTLAFVACDTANPSAYAVSIDSAKQIALSNVGATAEEASFSSIDTDVDKNGSYYDVEFVIEGVKYEYRINTSTGDITRIDVNDQTVDVNNPPVAPVSDKANYIGIEAAKAAALTDAGLAATAVTFTEAQFDFDDGKYLYEIEFNTAETEYEYEIDASTGAIYKKNTDKITVIVPTPSTGTYVGVDAAKTAAFSDLGVTEADVTLQKAVFEVDSGVHIYEVEFIHNAVEYEYEINATSGAVIRKSIDRDDTPATTVTTEQSGNYIGVDAAKQIALAHAGVAASEATFIEAQLDIERGVYVYEIEFKVGLWEYSYEINATSGVIVDAEKEIDD